MVTSNKWLGACRVEYKRLLLALSTSGGANASGVSPAFAGAPQGVVAAAFPAGEATNIDPNVLLAIAKVETNWARRAMLSPTTWVPADIQAHVDVAALQAGGATMALLGLTGGRRIGDWVNPQPVGPAQEHAMGWS
jgi:hypothetical protein